MYEIGIDLLEGMNPDPQDPNSQVLSTVLEFKPLNDRPAKTIGSGAVGIPHSRQLRFSRDLTQSRKQDEFMLRHSR
jgi:hypothetical protein